MPTKFRTPRFEEEFGEDAEIFIDFVMMSFTRLEGQFTTVEDKCKTKMLSISCKALIDQQRWKPKRTVLPLGWYITELSSFRRSFSMGLYLFVVGTYQQQSGWSEACIG